MKLHHTLNTLAKIRDDEPVSQEAISQAFEEVRQLDIVAGETYRLVPYPTIVKVLRRNGDGTATVEHSCGGKSYGVSLTQLWRY